MSDIQDQSEAKERLLIALAVIAAITLIGMTLFELAKQTIYPKISIWQSPIATIVFSTLVATLASYYILRRIHVLHQIAIDELIVRAQTRESEQRVQTILDNLLVGVLCIQNDYLTINRAMEEITGYDRDELSTLDAWFSSLYGEREQEIRRIYESDREAGLPNKSIPIAITRKDSNKRFVELTTYKLDNQEFWLMQDVTKRQQAEQALRESEARLQAILNTAAEAIITIDRRGLLNSVNPAAGKMFGYTQEELVGQSAKILMPQPYSDEYDSYLNHYLETGETHIIGIGHELTGKRKDGSTFPIDLTVSEIDHLSLFTGMIRDISDNKELQKQVLEVAAEEDRRIGQELHDGIQQEVTGLEMFAGMLLDRLDAAEQREVQGKAIRLLEEARFLKLRDYADKIRKGLAETHAHVRQLSHGIMPVQIDALGLNAALTELASATDALQDITCRFKSSEVVEVEDNTAATHLYRIAQEAVNNALRHSQGDHIYISLARQQDQLILEVSDNGVGIAPAISCRVAVPSGTKSIGLRTMHYRAGLIGATLRIGRRKEGGTRVRCTLQK